MLHGACAMGRAIIQRRYYMHIIANVGRSLKKQAQKAFAFSLKDPEDEICGTNDG